MIRRIVGRESDYVVTAAGVKRPVDQGFYKLSAIEAVREFQIAQTSRGSIEARVVLSRPLTEGERDHVFALLEAEFGSGFMFSISQRKSIERTEAGKLRAFVNELPRPATPRELLADEAYGFAGHQITTAIDSARA